MIPNYAVLFKSHVWDDYSRRQLSRLEQVCKLGAIFIFKDQTKGFQPVDSQHAVINASESGCETLGLQLEPEGNLFWYCNDYPTYFLFKEQPNFDYYAVVEYDDACRFSIDDVVASVASRGLDCVAEPHKMPMAEWHWADTGRDVYGSGIPTRGALFSFAIFSRAAVARLFAVRQLHTQRWKRGELSTWPYGELFMATEVANAGFSMAPLAEFTSVQHYKWWPPVLERELESIAPPATIHPALDEPRYIASCFKFTLDLADYFVADSELSRLVGRCPREIVIPALLNELRQRRQTTLIERVKASIAPDDQEALGGHSNVALGKRATQSSVSSWSRRQDVGLDAAGAVNGIIDGQYSFHTGQDEPAWWMVDLGSKHEITEIRVHNRLDVRHRARNLFILLSDTALDWAVVARREGEADFGGADGQPYRFAPANPLTGRFVRVQLEGPSILHLDEVEVFGEPL